MQTLQTNTPSHLQALTFQKHLKRFSPAKHFGIPQMVRKAKLKDIHWSNHILFNSLRPSRSIQHILYH